MNVLAATVTPVSDLIRTYLTTTCLAMAATFVAIYSAIANRIVRSATRRLPFLGRFAVFVLWCASGYGLVTIALGTVAARALEPLDDLWLAPIVTGIFVVLGFLAEREGHV